jgi:hypothetical protein
MKTILPRILKRSSLPKECVNLLKNLQNRLRLAFEGFAGLQKLRVFISMLQHFINVTFCQPVTLSTKPFICSACDIRATFTKL